MEAIRVDYTGEGLSEDSAPGAPLEIVRGWVAAALQRQAEHGDVPEPSAMQVATVDADGPDVRTVLMRGLDARGPAFFTNTGSAKGRQLAADPAIAATITWPGLHRAIRFRGRAEPLSAQEVHDYWVTRPWGSRVGAHASRQSSVVPDRESLESAYRECAERFPDLGGPDDVPVPQDWGGYRILVDRVELWAGRRSRLHDRLVWERVGPGGMDEPTAWHRLRLAP